MINADEHKNLLAQINELERNSVNYFDVEKEFFLITSDNLHTIRPKLYGYSIQRDGIYEDDNLTAEAVAGLNGRGRYVYVDVRDGKIKIKQDSNGQWGIYLFRHGDYFALSNSFFRLLDHVKFRYPLTVNRDYCHHMMANLIVCSHAYLETAVNEIKDVERNAILHIDIAKKSLEIELIDYKEHSVPLDSEEGVAILDRWVEFWSGVLRGIAQNTNFLSADLTGGFDSRMNFLLLLNSGIDLNKIRINTSTSNVRSINLEDYEIASQIAEHYGFKLNKPLPANPYLNYSLEDVWNVDLYSKQTFCQPHSLYNAPKYLYKKYHLAGFSGEVLRDRCHKPPQKFIDDLCMRTRPYSFFLAQELANSIQRIIKSAFNNICDKYQIEDPNSIDIPQYLYHEAFNRNHCGRLHLPSYLKNTVMFLPFCDPEIQTVQLKTTKCPDYNLLMTLLFTRYAPDLLKIRFDKFHAPLDFENLIPCAQEINERFPLRLKNENNVNGGGQFHLQPRDLQVEKIISSGRNNPSISSKLFEACLKAAFDSSRTYGLFTTYFDVELYHYAADFYENHVFARAHHLYTIVGIAKVLEDVEISQHNYQSYRDMQRFIEQDFATIPANEEKKILKGIVDKFQKHITARVDVRFYPKDAKGDFQILSLSDSHAKISKPTWLNKDDVSYMITSYMGELELVAKSTVDGQIKIYLWTLNYRDPQDNSKKIPYWIDYTKLIVNDETIFDTVTPAWHGKAYSYNMEVKANEEIRIQVEWLPHRSDT